MSKHTPGPWVYTTSLQGERGRYIRGANDEQPGKMAIARICGRGGYSEYTANARLIAAAPDLLEALLFVLKYESMGAVTEATARAAIAKATGETK